MVYRDHTCCDPKFKQLIYGIHKRYNKYKTNRYVSGRKLNAYFKINCLDDNIKYRVCSNINDQLKNYNVPWKRKENDVIIAPKEPARFSRRLNPSKMDINKMKKVSIRVGTKEYPVIDLIEEEITPKKKVYRSRSQVLYDELSECSKKYKYPMLTLTAREQTKRMHNLSNQLVGSCVDRNLLKEGPIPNRIFHNKELAIEVITTIDRIKQKIQDMFCINLLSLGNEMTGVEESEAEKELDVEVASLSSAYSLLGNTARSGYNKIMRELLTEFNLCPKKLPSYHLLTSRNRPNIVPFIIPNSNELHSNSHEITENIDIEDISEPHDEPGLQPKEVLSASSFVSNKPESLSEAIQAIWKSKRVENEVIGAMIAGGFKEYVVRMANKHIRKGRTLSGDILVINSYDGAEYTNTKKGKTGIVSFSFQICSTSTIKNGASTAKSMNIFTWQQMVGDENRKNIFPAIKETLKEIKQLKENGIPEIPNTNITYFELHNGKMLYLLTQHSLFNCKHFPFLLCKCQRG